MKRTSSAQSLPASSLSHSSMHNASLPNSNPATPVSEATTERKCHTDPTDQRKRLNERERAKARAYAAKGGMHSLRHCTTVPEEESISTSLHLPLQHNNIVPSFQPRHQVRVGQDRSDTQSEVYLNHSRSQTPSTVAEHCSLGNAAMGMSTPTRLRRIISPRNSMRPSSSLSMGDDLRGQSRYRSATPRESLSIPASEQWSANFDPDTMEEPFSEFEESGEYNGASLPRDVSSRCSTAASGLSYTSTHNHSYPHESKARSACSNPFPMGHHEKQFPFSQHPAHSYCSLPTAIPSPIYPSPHSAFQCGQQEGHMVSRYQHRQQG